VDKAIANSGWADISDSNLTIPKDLFKLKPGEKIFWRFEASFPSGFRLTAAESHYWNDEGQHYRKIRYRLMSVKGELIFQVDTHQSAISFEDSPHLHIGPQEDLRVSDGDPRLNECSLRDFDFLKMWNWVQDYLEDGRLPWER
jgi:hypothetical protein